MQSRVLYPRHVVQATGQPGKMYVPDIKDIDQFRGDRIWHSSEFPGADPEANNNGKSAVVVGSCNPAHDIAQDLYAKGYAVTMFQRGSMCVISTGAASKIGLGGLYLERGGPPVEDADLWLWSLPSEILKAQQIHVTALQSEHERDSGWTCKSLV